MNKYAEIIRACLRSVIVFFFLGSFGYVLYKYVGLENGMIEPNVLYSWLTGLIMGFIAFYFKENGNQDKKDIK